MATALDTDPLLMSALREHFFLPISAPASHDQFASSP